MSFDRQVQVLIEQASTQYRLSNYRGAIELLQRALATDPNHAGAHAWLGLALLGAKRVPGAAIEAGLALAFDADDPFCHYVAAAVARAQRKLDDAWSHALIAMQADTTNPSYLVLGAEIRGLRGDATEARRLLQDALELAADHTDALIAMARIELEARNHEAAARYAREALESDPEDVEAHVVAGMVALVAGDDAEAERHARFALNTDSTAHDAIHLWCAVKARRSPILGLWWRFTAFVSIRSESGQLGLLIGSFVVVRLVIILAQHYDLDTLASVLSWAWLGFCAYTWFAPELFKRWLKADLGEVRLDPNY